MNTIRKYRKIAQWTTIVVFFLLVSQFNFGDVAIAQSGGECTVYDESCSPPVPNYVVGHCIRQNGERICCATTTAGDHCWIPS